MRVTRLLLLVILTGVLAWMCNKSINVGGNPLPPLGSFFSPFEGYIAKAENPVSDDIENTIDGISSTVEIVFDDRMVPHIFAQNLEDAYFAQGYIHSRDRMWQMDFMTRSVSGRLSEVVGAAASNYDRQQLRNGLLFGAERAVNSWKEDKESYKYIEAYVAGANAALENMDKKDWPLEYQLLDYKPEQWSALKSALVAKAMAQDLCFRNPDLSNTLAVQSFGVEGFTTLYNDRLAGDRPIIPSVKTWDFDTIWQPHDTLPLNIVTTGGSSSDSLMMPEAGLGSNNWAVAGSKTKSGYPILCNDPHLALRLPSVWYEVHIHTPDMNVRGVSLPGMPTVVIGYNEDVAWGLTNGGHDVLDWYKIQWVDRDKGIYRWGNEERQVAKRVEEIKVKGGETIKDTVWYTHLGPITYDDSEHPLYDCAMRWIAHDKPRGSEIKTFMGLNRAKNYDDYLSATYNYSNPIQNFVFASNDGDIALRVSGDLPLRKWNQGKVVLPGDNPDLEWKNFIPKHHMPIIKNPDRGYVSSANQWATDSSYPYYYSGGYEYYRNRYLNDQLDSMDAITPEMMMALQQDNSSYRALETIKALRDRIVPVDLSAEETKTWNQLMSWDGVFDPDEDMAILFVSFDYELRRNTWDEMRNADSVYISYPEYWTLLDMISNDPGNAYFDVTSTPVKEGARELVSRAFKKAYVRFTKAKDRSDNWASYRGTVVRHMARIDALSSEKLSCGGFHDALNAISQTNGPSWRMVVELGEKPRAWAVYPGGQSGNPGSAHYLDFLEKWQSGEYYELTLDEKAADVPNNLFTLTLQPGS